MDHVALDGAGPHDRHLDHEIIERARLEARQHVHLRPAFDLENADRLRLAQHVVGRFVLAREIGERQIFPLVRGHQIERTADAGEHPEAQHIDLHQPDRGQIVLVPFDECALVHRPVADRHDLHERAARQHEAADVLRQMAREADQFLGQAEHALQQRIAGIEPRLAHALLRQRAIGADAPDHAGERGDNILGQSHHLADLAHGGAGPVADDGGGEPRAVAAIAPVDLLDHLLAPRVLEIDVDIRRLLAVGADEALEQQIDLGRIDRGDPEAVADRRVRRRAAPLAQDLLAARETDDVVDGQKIGRVVELIDQREFPVEAGADFFRHAGGKIDARALLHEIDEMGVRCLAGRNRLVGILVFELVERECAGLGDLDRAREGRLVSGEKPRHVGWRLEMALGVGREPQAGLADAHALADAGQHVLERASVRGVIEHVPRRHEGHAAPSPQRVERGNVRAIVATIGVRGREIESRAAERCLEAPQRRLEAVVVRRLYPSASHRGGAR